jgi:aspartate/methionine/tyrosine aminotransferase
LEWIADTFLSVSTPVQLALPRILAASGVIEEQIRTQTRSNLDYLIKRPHGSPCRCLPVEGGWYAVLEVPRVRGEEDWVLHLLAQKDVLVQPGFFYDFESEAFLVLSLLTPPAIFEQGVCRILDAMRALT